MLDPGATISVVGPQLAQRFRNRLELADSSLKVATGQISQILGTLKIKLDMAGCIDNLTVKAVTDVRHEIILGMDFGRIWNVKLQFGKGPWRTKWRLLDKGDN